MRAISIVAFPELTKHGWPCNVRDQLLGQADRSNLTRIITGAGNGIGLCIVQQLLESQDVQLIVGIDLVIENLKPFHKDHPDRLELITGDVSERLTSERAVNLAVQKAGKIDTLILNAGIAQPIGPINSTDIQDWKHNFDVNFFAMLHTVRISTRSFSGG